MNAEGRDGTLVFWESLGRTLPKGACGVRLVGAKLVGVPSGKKKVRTKTALGRLGIYGNIKGNPDGNSSQTTTWKNHR